MQMDERAYVFVWERETKNEYVDVCVCMRQGGGVCKFINLTTVYANTEL